MFLSSLANPLTTGRGRDLHAARDAPVLRFFHRFSLAISPGNKSPQTYGWAGKQAPIRSKMKQLV